MVFQNEEKMYAKNESLRPIVNKTYGVHQGWMTKTVFEVSNKYMLSNESDRF